MECGRSPAPSELRRKLNPRWRSTVRASHPRPGARDACPPGAAETRALGSPPRRASPRAAPRPPDRPPPRAVPHADDDAPLPQPPASSTRCATRSPATSVMMDFRLADGEAARAVRHHPLPLGRANRGAQVRLPAEARFAGVAFSNQPAWSTWRTIFVLRESCRLFAQALAFQTLVRFPMRPSCLFIGWLVDTR